MEIGKLFNILGWVAMAASISMYVSYIPQISDNLAGHKGNPILLANLPGIVFGLFAFATAL